MDPFADPFENTGWRRPNFFLVGAQRSGTTSLWKHLGEHPNVFMPARKEPLFLAKHMAHGFGSTPDTADTVDEYMRLFPKTVEKKIVGEASAIYYACPWVPKRICKWFPEAKIVIILRNPVERAWSHFRKHARQGHPMFSSSFEDALREVKVYELCKSMRWNFGYISLGMYSKYLLKYKKFFPSKNIKVVLFDDLKNEPKTTIQDIYNFLGLSIHSPTKPEKAYNTTGIYSRLRKMYDRNFYESYKKISSTDMSSFLKQLYRKAGSLLRNKNMSMRVRERLVEVFRKDIQKTQNIIDRDINHWVV